MRGKLQKDGGGGSMKKLTGVALAFAAIASGACSSKPDHDDLPNGDTASPVAGTPPSGGETMAGTHSMDGMAAMTGNADRDFLRMMADHHKGMLLMTDRAQAKGTTVRDEAMRMAKEQSGEIDRMTSILRAAYSDSYDPKAMATAKTMASELDSLAGTAFDKGFLQRTIMHHRAAIKMIEEYLPRAKRSDVRAMAERMKAAQEKEIREFEGKIAAL